MSSRRKLEELYNLYEQPMYRVAFSILGTEYQAEDAVSEAFIKIAENLSNVKYINSEKTRHYIIKIIKNVSINMYRRNQFEKKLLSKEDEMSEVKDEKAEKEMKRVEDAGIIDNILSRMPEKHREIIIMRCIYEMSYYEIARCLDESVTTVRKQYERAKKMALRESEGKHEI